MNDPKPIASLSPALLARKGGAKPAMRRQVQPSSEITSGQLEDLGFNDFGAEVVQLNPGRSARVAARARPRRSALADGRSAAFTLRLDAERHLKLRLACTLEGRSAQQLVTDALDQMISSIPDVAQMAVQARKRGK
jgi:hypothetical protein